MASGPARDATSARRRQYSGEFHSLAARADGAVFGFGSNSTLQIGVTAPARVATATQVAGLTGATLVAGGGGHSLALQAVATPTSGLDASATGPGVIAVNPGGGRYEQGTAVTITATANSGALFTDWMVNGVATGFANPLVLTMTKDYTVVATFGAPKAFCDVNPNDPYFEEIRQLSARGVINGFAAADDRLCFGPNDNTLRHQMAALIIGAMPG